MPKELPVRPNLEHLKNEAKALLRSHKQGDPSACKTLQSVARLSRLSSKEILASQVTLQEAQHAVAREYGFASWKALKDHVIGETAYAKRLRDAYEVFVAKGPAHNSTGSKREQEIGAKTKELLDSGQDGFRIMTELACSHNGRARNVAAIYFGLSEDERSDEILTSLFADESVSVRSRALRMFAARIHPGCGKGNGWAIAKAAKAIPDGVKSILPLVRDKSVKVKLDAIRALSAYAALLDKDVLGALNRALRDPHHKIHHAAAKALGKPCPGCGAKV